MSWGVCSISSWLEVFASELCVGLLNGEVNWDWGELTGWTTADGWALASELSCPKSFYGTFKRSVKFSIKRSLLDFSEYEVL